MFLTDIAVRNAKPESKPRKLADEKGLFLLIHFNGSKYWRFKCRIGVIGIYPYASLAQASQRRDDARKLLVNEVDPGILKQEQNERIRK